MDQSFPSLVDEETLTEDSFWPSFTDILTVIVMIFLMAMLVLLLRNMDLITRLQDTISQKEKVFQQSEFIKQRNLSLTTQVQESEARRVRLQEQQQELMLRLEQETALQAQQNRRLQQQQVQLQQLRQQTTEQAAMLATKSAAIEQLETSQIRIEARYDMTRQALAAATAESASLQTQLDTVNLHVDALNHNLTLLRDNHAKTLKTNTQALLVWRLRAEKNAQALVQLTDEYSGLQARYIRLLRPARSPRNKHVVEVLYDARNAGRVYALREGHGQAWNEIARTTLEQQLTNLKQQYGDTLYVRIIIPDNSDISFNEAWGFTHQMLKRYDYYYQRK